MAPRRQTLSLISTLFQSILFASRVEAYRETASHSPVPSQAQECPIFSTSAVQCNPPVPKSFLPPEAAAALGTAGNGRHQEPDVELLDDMLNALDVLQDEFYAIWLGTWPDGIDWTRAVLGTHVSGGTRTLSESLASVKFSKDRVQDWKLKSNLVDSYFTQIVAYYFGEDDFAIRHQAYDDMLWVVLGWLEAVKFLNTHTDLHFTLNSQGTAEISRLGDDDSIPRMLDTVLLSNQTYHGNLWIPAFSHRARIFWDLASHGWDTELCGGGMIWNPRLLPYKNAITNELFIAASISMYLYFPGDDNESPFYQKESGAGSTRARGSPSSSSSASGGTTYGRPRDPKYLKAAVDGYRWLAGSNMTDARGLYTDGFHISGYGDRDGGKGNNNTRCDEREDTVLTYNQGVLLTGLRGLWEATGAPSYLADGHALVQNVVRATGYDLRRDAPSDDVHDTGVGGGGGLPRWHGLGRAGVLEDPCDASAVCNQDATTFKGIYFHHLVAFCTPLTVPPFLSSSSSSPNSDGGEGAEGAEGERVHMEAFNATKEAHEKACAAYRGWLGHNAKAALATRDADGKFGQWWTAGLLKRHWSGPWPSMETDGVPHETNISDYTLWRGPYGFDLADPDPGAAPDSVLDADAFEDDDDDDDDLALVFPGEEEEPGSQQKPLSRTERGDLGVGDSSKKKKMMMMKKKRRRGGGVAAPSSTGTTSAEGRATRDPNERGRGRTVETHSGGLALLRAYWKIGQLGAAA